MEKISAASAMEWSIELDKGLRSRKPGQALKAIQQTGLRLQQWDEEPEPTMAAHKIFDLVAGEESFFLNCILLKLADAFRSGDKDIRVSVVKVFLSLFKLRRKTKRYHGVMSKAKMCNPLELLKRVKIVFDTGDLESRVLALVLFGSWADFARDNAHIRYIILSSLVSSDVMEVKASLFAAGCFCEFADDFAPVVLEMLPRIVASSELSSTLRVAGANVFAKMRYFSPNAINGYKMGLKLLLNSSDEDLSVSLLLSLSKLAYKSSSILPDQVEVLLSFLSQDKPLHQQSTALRCLRLLSSPVCYHNVGLLTVKPLLRIVHDTELPISMQCNALQILHKMFMYQELNMPCDVMSELSKVSTIFGNANQSHLNSKCVLAISVLADVLIKNSRKTGIELDGNCDAFPSLTWIISTIIGQIISLVKQMLDSNQSWDGALPEVTSLLNLLFVAGEHLDLGVIVLDRIRLVIDYLVNQVLEKAIDSTVTAPPGQEVDHFGANSFSTILNIANKVHKFSAACIPNLIEHGTSAAEVLGKVNMLVDCVHRCSLLGSYVHAVYSIQAHSSVFWGCAVNENKEGCSANRQVGNSDCDLLIKHEIFTLECAMKMLKEKNFWKLYMTGKFAAGQGAWVTAKFIFEQIASKVRSESSSCWLSSLAQHAQCEMIIQLFLLPKLRCSLAEWSLTKEIPIPTLRHISCGRDDRGVSFQVCGESYTKVLVGAHSSIRSSLETLDCVVKFGNPFYFQRWFLALRTNVLATVCDVLKVLGSSDSGHAEGSLLEHGLSSVQQITQCSFRLMGLAKELDLLYISFVDMDIKSSKIISALALSCSLLAFTTGIAASFATVRASDNSDMYLNRMSIEDFAGRLWLIDPDTCSVLFQLLDVRPGIDHPYVQPRNQKLGSCEVKDITSICHETVSRVDEFRNELRKRVDNLEVLHKVTVESFQLLLNTIVKWLHIPFQLPMYFFRTRPCLVSELFASTADATNQNELIVRPGCDLSLNLCIQLKNIPNLSTPIRKLYCIVYSSTSFAESGPTSRGTKAGQIEWVDFKDWDIDDMVQANEKLFSHMRDRANKTTDRRFKRPRNEEEIVQRVVHFEVNNRGQGFSSCLFDVSGFPEGCYRIKWHSCCFDGRGRYWSLLPANSGPVFTVCRS